METRYDLLKKLLGPGLETAVDPKFKISLYVFNDAVGYVEFVRTIENREVETGTQGNANLGVEEPYLAAIDPLNGRDDPFLNRKPARSKTRKNDEATGPERTLAGLLVEQFAVGAVPRANSKAPRWLSLGLGAFGLSSRAADKSLYPQTADSSVPTIPTRLGRQIESSSRRRSR